MKSFADHSNFLKLNKDSPFHELAQIAIQTYYHIPYPTDTFAEVRVIKRPLHGGVHVSHVAIHIDLLIALYKKYKPELLIKPDGSPITEEDIKKLKLAAIYHDSSNTNETTGEEKVSADHYRRDMQQLGYTPSEIEPFAMAIQEKDGTKGKNNIEDEKAVLEKNILQVMLHDADVFDIMRVKKIIFQKNFLNVLIHLGKNPGFVNELDEIIANHTKTAEKFDGVRSFHAQCELADNCYLKVKQAHWLMLTEEIFVTFLKKNKKISFKEINEYFHETDFSILDLYNRKNVNKHKKVIDHIQKQADRVDEKLSPQEEKYSTRVKELMQTTGCLIRSLDAYAVEGELQTLQQNAKIIKELKITDSEKLRSYILEQKEQKKLAPTGFKWRPCTFIEKDIFVSTFTSPEPMIIIDPTLESTLTAFFYKKNAFSYKTQTGEFIYTPAEGPLKDKKNMVGIQKKIREMEERRRGVRYDPALHYFGNPNLPWSEILGTYQQEGVLGIIINKSVTAAFLMRTKLNNPFIPFYQYSYANGLKVISENTAIQQCFKEEDPVNKIDSSFDLNGLSDSAISRIAIHNFRLVNENPIQYQFPHPRDFKTTCTAWTKEGIPCIEWKLPNGNMSIQPTKLLRKIATNYIEYRIMELDLLLDLNKDKLKRKFNVTSLQFHLEVDFIRSKYYLRIQGKMNDATKKQYFLAELFKHLHLMDPKKVKISDWFLPETIDLRIPDAQKIHLIAASLKKMLCELDKEEAPPISEPSPTTGDSKTISTVTRSPALFEKEKVDPKPLDAKQLEEYKTKGEKLFGNYEHKNLFNTLDDDEKQILFVALGCDRLFLSKSKDVNGESNDGDSLEYMTVLALKTKLQSLAIDFGMGESSVVSAPITNPSSRFVF